MIDYKKVGLKAGLEVHLQLDTKYKLFCNSSAAMKEKEPIMIIVRKQHPVASELGEVDRAAQFEYLKDRTFNYQVFANETCTVELDEEPPHTMNNEALRISLQIALMLNCKIPDEIQVMRKTVIDGSNPSSFQRTAIVGTNGYLEYKNKKVEITQVTLEEDAAALVDEENGKVTYRLNRLGVPLVEIDTGVLAGYTPQEIQEIAYLIGMVGRSTGRTKIGIGSIRQDVNVSITKGARVEIKGVQELGLLAKVIENEIKRQMEAKKVEEETRSAKPDGTTEFMRPLPGANRMYPETDIFPVSISAKFISELKKALPESFLEKLEKFKSKLKLPNQLAKQILESEYLQVFEQTTQKDKNLATLAANVLTSVVKDLKRRNVTTENLTENNFLELFEEIRNKKIVKESVSEILEHIAKNPQKKITVAVKELGLTAVTTVELNKIIKELVTPEMNFDKALGIVMSKVRGRIEAKIVVDAVKKFLKK